MENKQEVGEINGSLGLNEYQICVDMVTVFMIPSWKHCL